MKVMFSFLELEELDEEHPARTKTKVNSKVNTTDNLLDNLTPPISLFF
jgi:hypothetical protein